MTREFESTVFWIAIAAGVTLAVLLGAAAYPISYMVGHPQIVPILLGFCPLFFALHRRGRAIRKAATGRPFQNRRRHRHSDSSRRDGGRDLRGHHRLGRLEPCGATDRLLGMPGLC